MVKVIKKKTGKIEKGCVYIGKSGGRGCQGMWQSPRERACQGL